MDGQVSPTPRWAIWLNALWFSSLIFSLSAASIGILVKQWLNEYSMGLSGASRQIARLRQYRLGNLVKWHVVEIVAVLPVLLQIALVLFFGGLLTLLWNLNKTVATIASVPVAILVTFTVGSALLPAFMASCCYLSPPAFVFFEAMRLIRATLCPLRRAISDGLDNVKGGLHDSIARHVDRLSLWLWRVDQSFKFTRRGRELQDVSSSAGDLDTQMVAMAYATTMDADYLEDATICFTDLNPEQVVTCFRAIDAENIRHRRDNWTLIHTMPAPICSDVWLALHMVKRDTRFSNRVEEYLRGSRLSMDSITWNYLIANLSIVTTGDKPFALFETLLVNRSHDHMVLQESLAQRGEWATSIHIASADNYHGKFRVLVALLMESALREHLHIADLESLDICCTVLRILLTYLVIHDHADAQPATETARAIRVLTIHGLVTYFDFRASFPWNDMPYGWIPSYENSLITLLHEHGQTRNLLSTGLVDALVRYAAVYELYPPWLQLQENREWMLELKCKGYPSHEQVYFRLYFWVTSMTHRSTALGYPWR